MKVKKRWIPGFLFLLSLLVIAFGYFLVHPEVIGWCPQALDINCLGQGLDLGIGHPLYWGIQWLPFFFFFLIFVPREIFVSWAKLAWWVALLFFLVIISFPPIGNPLHLTPDRTQVTAFMTHLFVIVSLLWIGWKYWRVHGRAG